MTANASASIRLFLLAASALSGACQHAHEKPAAGPSAARCTPELVIQEAFAGEGAAGEGARRCNQGGGTCDYACTEATRSCVLDAVRAQRLFVAIWSGNYFDGVGRRFAVTGRRTGDAYRITWLDYSFASGYAPSGVKDGDTHQWIVSRACSALVDLREECGPDGGHRLCDTARDDREAALELGCVTASERTICDERLD